jgi:hypothetical protein
LIWTWQERPKRQAAAAIFECIKVFRRHFDLGSSGLIACKRGLG